MSNGHLTKLTIRLKLQKILFQEMMVVLKAKLLKVSMKVFSFMVFILKVHNGTEPIDDLKNKQVKICSSHSQLFMFQLNQPTRNKWTKLHPKKEIWAIRIRLTISHPCINTLNEMTDT